MPPKKKASKAVVAKSKQDNSPAKSKKVTAAQTKASAAASKKAAPAQKSPAKSPAGSKRAAAPAKGRGGKKSKSVAKEEEDEDEEATSAPQSTEVQKMIVALKNADKIKKSAKVDQYFSDCKPGGKVLDDYDCMLNQTNIGHNNNKFYVIQVIQVGTDYYSWNRWGRVGETGQNAVRSFKDSAKAIHDFEKKFKDKTRNEWKDRGTFRAVPGKYTLIEMGDDDEEGTAPVVKKLAIADSSRVTRVSKLDEPTQALIGLIFNNDMFNDALKNMEIDTKKMPLGKISKAQIAKGFEALEKIDAKLKNLGAPGTFAELSSLFYTVIPHNFGRQRPPTISDPESLQKKMDMLTVLSDIEVAQAMQKDKKDDSNESIMPHPLDVQYSLLKCNLNLLNKTSETFKILENYLRATERGFRMIDILEIWEVDRHDEDKRFAKHKGLLNRKLLWHGTNVAVVAAILQSGLRIMPHSGGRVGRGIYFASENSKSAAYVRPAAGGIAIMFLNEVALGDEHHILMDDSSLYTAPIGFHSIVAKGRTEPDPSLDKAIDIDGLKVVVPQGKPIRMPQYQSSSFSQSEYLVYQEDQCRIRFVLKLKFN